MKRFSALAFSAVTFCNAHAPPAEAQVPEPAVRDVETALRVLPRLDARGGLVMPFSYYRGRMTQTENGRIRFVQEAPNGVLDADEQTALRVFQQSQNLEATGTITQETTDRIRHLFSVDSILTRFDMNRSDSPLRDTVAALLLNEIGAGEITGNNDGPDIERYFASPQTGAWCAAVVNWAFREAGRMAGSSEDILDNSRYYIPRVSEMYRFAVDNNAFVARTAGRVPARGDILIHRYLNSDDGGTGHAQLVVDVRRDAASGEVVLVLAEGNATRPTTLPDPTGANAQYVVVEGNVMVLTIVPLADLEGGPTSEYAGFIDIGALPGFARLDAALGRIDLSRAVLPQPAHLASFGSTNRVETIDGRLVITPGVVAPFNPAEMAALQILTLRLP